MWSDANPIKFSPSSLLKKGLFLLSRLMSHIPHMCPLCSLRDTPSLALSLICSLSYSLLGTSTQSKNMPSLFSSSYNFYTQLPSIQLYVSPFFIFIAPLLSRTLQDYCTYLLITDYSLLFNPLQWGSIRNSLMKLLWQKITNDFLIQTNTYLSFSFLDLTVTFGS